MTNCAGSGGVEETENKLVDETIYYSMPRLMEEIEEVLEYTAKSREEKEFYLSDRAFGESGVREWTEKN